MKIIFITFSSSLSWSTWSDWVRMPALMSWVRFRLFQTFFLFSCWKNLFIPVPFCPRKTASPGMIFSKFRGFECRCWWNISSAIWSSKVLNSHWSEWPDSDDNVSRSWVRCPGLVKTFSNVVERRLNVEVIVGSILWELFCSLALAKNHKDLYSLRKGFNSICRVGWVNFQLKRLLILGRL